MSFTNLPPFIWQFAAETDGKRGQGAEVSPRESNRGHNHTTCIINHMVTSLSSSCSPLSLLLLLSPPPPPLSLLSTSHCLLLGAVWSLEACHQRCMLGKYYHRSFWQIDKRYEYPWGTFICDIFSKPQHTELKHTFTVLCMHTCINIYTHSHTHTHTLRDVCPLPAFVNTIWTPGIVYQQSDEHHQVNSPVFDCQRGGWLKRKAGVHSDELLFSRKQYAHSK